MTRWWMAVMLVVAGVGCVGEDDEVKPDDLEEVGKADRWNTENDPNRFQVQMNYVLATLPRNGTAERAPWSENWWPMRKDGFNQRWQSTSTLSPLEKYDQAFNGWTPSTEFMALRPFSYPGGAFDAGYYEGLGPAAKWESANGGNLRIRNGRDDDGDGQTDEADDWDGLGGWWGKCHMWSAAAVISPEPQRAVTINGVTFEYSDITALEMESYYNRARSYMIGGRCNDTEVARDANGRATNVACRDTNAGSFHVVVANMLGVHRRAFVMDKSSDSEVWNHPVSDFAVDRLEEVPLARALELLGLPAGPAYPYNPDAKTFWSVRTRLGYVTDGVRQSTRPHGSVREEDVYEYLLEVDAAGKVIGGEWIGETGPDFFWLPVLSSYSRGGNPNVKLANVEELVRQATQTTPPPSGGSETRLETAAALAIPDNLPAGITSSATPTGSGTVATLKVAVAITHSYVGDLRIDLRHAGRTVRLYSGEDGATANLSREFAVPDLAGVDLAGPWELLVRDEAARDTGTLDRWTLVYTAAAGSASGPARRTVTASAATRFDIPDNTPAGVVSGANVAETGTVRALTVTVDVRHTYVGDLKVSLRHQGTSIVLHDRKGGSADDIVREFTLAEFNGTTVTGAWELVVSDHARKDKGHIASWSLSATVE